MQKNEIKFALIPFVFTQLVYLLTLAPTVTSEDSGELITASSKLGVAHPPGYPLFCLIGYVFSKLPFSVVWNLNYMSAFFASGTCFVLYFILRRLDIEKLPAIIGSCLLGVSWHFWNQAIIAEVYSLNAFTFSIILWLAILLRQSYSWKKAYIFCFVFGLALTNHYMLTLLVSPAIGFYLFSPIRKNFNAKKFMLSLFLLVVPLSLYFYLIIVAKTNPVINWGDPSDMTRWLAHIKRDAYKSLELEKDIPFSVKLAYYYQFVYLLVSQFTALIIIPFVLWGLKLWQNKKADLFLVIGIIVFNSFVLLSILKFSAEMENFTRVEEYYLPAYVCVAILITMGLQRVYTALVAIKMPYGFLLVLLPFYLSLMHWRSNDFSQYYLAYDYNKAILNDLPENAIYFPSGDYNAFPAIYLQAVEGLRPDILIADVTGDLEKAVIRLVDEIDSQQIVFNDLKEKLKDSHPNLKKYSMPVVQKVLIEKGSRPVFFTSKSDIKPYSDYTVLNHGLVYIALKKGETTTIKSKIIFSDDLLRNIPLETAQDDLGQSIYSNVYQMWGEDLLLKNQIEEGLKKFDKAVKYSNDSKEGLNNLASSLSEFKQFQKAISLYERAVLLHPNYKTARVNLYRSYQSVGDVAKANAILDEIAFIEGKKQDEKKSVEHKDILKSIQSQLINDPNNASLHHDLGVAYANLGDLKNAQIQFEKAVELNPNFELAIRNLVKLYQQTNQKPEKQKELLEGLKK